MYLRLKCYSPTGAAAVRQPAGGPPTLASLRDELLRRHYSAFDWQNGGPPGPIKFVDVHQLELAGHLARAGDCRARLMMERYVHGIEHLVTRPDSGAAHYATGPAWDTPCLARTLGGQAVVIQALVIAGRLKRSCAHARLVPNLSKFATARWSRTFSGDANAAGSGDRAAAGVLAWYVSALRAFAELYDNVELRAAAHRGFEQLTIRLGGVNGELRYVPSHLTLADRVAVANVASEFSLASGDVGLAQFARRSLLEATHRHAHPAGGWIEAYRDGAPADIDCSIDLVRTADALHNRAHPELARIAADGKRSLFKPESALARTSESGLLLLLADTSDDNVQRAADAFVRNRQSRFVRDRDKLLVNVRK